MALNVENSKNTKIPSNNLTILISKILTEPPQKSLMKGVYIKGIRTGLH